jgi:tetratricopeptide (TPR) repeat protein
VTNSTRWTTLALLGAALLTGCQTMRPPRDAASVNPDAEVAEIRNAWATQPPSGMYAGQESTTPALRARVESVAFHNPRHVSSRYLAALMAYQDNERNVAVHHLDDLLTLDPTNADAAALRARIALEDGNTPYAMKMLEDRINLRPDHAGLREALASAYFLDGQLDKAVATLNEAERLGAPKDRIAYNRGLIEEAQGKTASAAENYRAALAVKPYWDMPKERLKGLGMPVMVAVPKPPAPPAAPATAAPATVAPATAAPATAPAAKVTPPPAAAPAPKVASSAPAPKAPPAKAPVAPSAGATVK